MKIGFYRVKAIKPSYEPVLHALRSVIGDAAKAQAQTQSLSHSVDYHPTPALRGVFGLNKKEIIHFLAERGFEVLDISSFKEEGIAISWKGVLEYESV